MFLIAGLGNPGRQYLNSRHNAGFMVIDYLQSYFNLPSNTSAKFNSEIASGIYGKYKIVLAKPLTYMNLSGNALQSICSYYKISLTNLIVIHDDIDLNLGVVKFKLGGGNGGHNGLKSIDSNLSNNYFRIRIGVGRPDNPDIDVADYVLSNFTKSENEHIEKIAKLITNNINLILERKFEEFKKNIV